MQELALKFIADIWSLQQAATMEAAGLPHNGFGRKPPLSGMRPTRIRRSIAEIEDIERKVVDVCLKHSEGMTVEQISAELKLSSKELAKPVEEGLKRGVLKKKGQKRGTKYFAGARR